MAEPLLNLGYIYLYSRAYVQPSPRVVRSLLHIGRQGPFVSQLRSRPLRKNGRGRS